MAKDTKVKDYKRVIIDSLESSILKKYYYLTEEFLKKQKKLM